MLNVPLVVTICSLLFSTKSLMSSGSYVFEKAESIQDTHSLEILK